MKLHTIGGHISGSPHICTIPDFLKKMTQVRALNDEIHQLLSCARSSRGFKSDGRPIHRLDVDTMTATSRGASDEAMKTEDRDFRLISRCISVLLNWKDLARAR